MQMDFKMGLEVGETKGKIFWPANDVTKDGTPQSAKKI